MPLQMMNTPFNEPRINDPLPGLEPHASPSQAPASRAPAVVKWYKAYCMMMVILYFIGMIGGVALLAYRPTIAASAPELSMTEITIRAIVLIIACFVMFVGTIAALVLPPLPWTWIYHLVNIGLGLSGCCFFVTIPLMIYWLKPETQEYFGRNTSGSTPPPSNLPPPPIPSV